jgi:hypothetical protein
MKAEKGGLYNLIIVELYKVKFHVVGISRWQVPVYST